MSDLSRLLPPELPLAFRALASQEREWRGRLFLMVWAIYRHEAYAWSMALAANGEWARELRALTVATTDEQIEEGLRVAHEEVGAWRS